MNVEMTKVLGGGESWFYLYVDNRVEMAAHEDDKEKMKEMTKLRDEFIKLSKLEING